MKIEPPTLSQISKNFGFTESDIMDIREMLLKEVKRQNEDMGST